MKHCRICDQGNFSLILDLNSQPWGNHFLSADEVGKEPVYPLRLVYCHHCSAVQLDYTVSKETMFSSHTYLSGMTQTLKKHFQEVAQEVDSHFFSSQKVKRALDIGSNDGTQLKPYQELGYEVLGIDSCHFAAQIAKEAGIATLCRFFNYELAKELCQKFEVINASGVFFHLEELHSAAQGIKHLLLPKGVFVIQCMYLKQIIENVAFDQIYHEHLLYYTLHSLQALLQRHGLSLFDVRLSPIHGGSFIAYASHIGAYPLSASLQQLKEQEKKEGCCDYTYYQNFSQKVERLKQANLAYLQEKKAQGKTIYGLGAPVKGNTLLNYFGIGKKYLDCLVEKNPLRKDKYSPGMHLPVLLEEEMNTLPDVYYVLAWNFKQEILQRYHPFLQKGGELYFPIPAGEAL